MLESTPFLPSMTASCPTGAQRPTKCDRNERLEPKAVRLTPARPSWGWPYHLSLGDYHGPTINSLAKMNKMGLSCQVMIGDLEILNRCLFHFLETKTGWLQWQVWNRWFLYVESQLAASRPTYGLSVAMIHVVSYLVTLCIHQASYPQKESSWGSWRLIGKYRPGW